MSEPIWIEASDRSDAQDLTLTLARHGIRGVPFATGDLWFVRVPGSRESAPRLLRDLAVALESSRGVFRPVRGARETADAGRVHPATPGRPLLTA